MYGENTKTIAIPIYRVLPYPVIHIHNSGGFSSIIIQVYNQISTHRSLTMMIEAAMLWILYIYTSITVVGSAL